MTGNLIDSWNDFVSYVSYLKTGATSTNTFSCGCMSDKEIENKIKKYISSSESVDANEILKVVYGKNYQSKSEVENMIKQKIDAVIASAPEDLDTLKEIADKIADNKELVPVKLSQLQNDMYFITMDEVETYDSQLRSLIDSKQDAGNYLTEHQSLSEYAKKSELPSAYDDTELANRVEALENAGFLTEHQSLADYATKESVDAADNACAERTQNVISKEENDVVYLRKMISDLAGRLALVEIKQEAS